MQLINNRYRIKNSYKIYDDSVIYNVYDLWSDNEELLLKLFNNDSKNSLLFQELVDSFIELKSLRHKGLIHDHSFDIVESIDNKPTRTNQFFYTIDFVNGIKLKNHLGKLSLENILSIFCQLLEVVSYLAFRGFVYKFINPDNIFIINKEEPQIKLVDFAAISEKLIKNIYNEEFDGFIAPEVSMKQNNVRIASDIYSVGMILRYLLTGEMSIETNSELKILENIKLSEEQKSRVSELIEKLTNKDLDSRLFKVTEIVKEVNRIFNKDYKLNLKEERDVLNFGSRIVGRDKEIKLILDNDKVINNYNFNKKIIAFTGEEGIGKTRLLKELAYKLRMRGRGVYNTSVAESNNKELSPIIRILKSMIKDCDSKLIDTYGCELVKIIPEISESRNIKPSSMLRGNRERLRLYDRITKFILENIKKDPTYIIIDDFHNSDIETINLINYLVNSEEQAPLVLIVSYDKDLLKFKKAINDTIISWQNQNKLQEHRLLRLNLDETSELVKNILGIAYKAINFSTRLMTDTQGNPGHTEEAIKNLVATNELFINKNGQWDSTTTNYTSLYIPSNIEEAIKRQIELIDKELLTIAKYVSIFNTPVSKIIIRRIAEGSELDSDSLIDKLVTMKILDERVEDWGYTYDFYNRHLKAFIYRDISSNEKNELHRKAAEVLENIYSQQDRGNIDELIFHYKKSNQIEKAIEQTIMNAKKMKDLVGNLQCIHLWESAYSLMKDREDKDKLEVLSNLGNLYLLQGTTGKSIDSYEQCLKIANKLNENKYVAICYNGLSYALYRKYDMDMAKKYAEKAKTISEKHGLTEELLESVRLLNRVEISRGDYNKILDNTKKYLDIAIKNGYDLYAGHFYNHLGIVRLFNNQIEFARKNFVISYEYFQKSGDGAESTRALNNIGFIYSDYLNDMELAMAYYEEGLEISRKYQFLESEASFLNNIGELYFRTDDFEKAVEYIEKVENIASDIEDVGLVFLSHLNLGIIYLAIGKFDKCYNCYLKVKKSYNKGLVEDQQIFRYYYFLSNFYYTFGMYDKASEYVNKIKEGSSQSENIFTLNALFKELIIKYNTKKQIDKSELNELRNYCKNSTNYGEIRKGLLSLAHILLLNNDKKIANELIRDDEEISNIYTTEYLDLYKEMILSKQSGDYERLIKLLDKLRNTGYYDLELFGNLELGDICFNNGEYYKSVNHLLTALDLLYRLAKKISDKKLQVSFINKHEVHKIMDKLNTIIATVKGEEVAGKQYNQFNENMNLKDFFNIKKIVDLFNDDIFNIEYGLNSQSENGIAKNFEELILQLNNDYRNNLDTILKYAVNKTFANRGLICVHDFEKGELVTIASTSEEDYIQERELIISEVLQKKRGVLINKSFDYDEDINHLKINDNIKAMICMPIFKLETLIKDSNIKDRRKNRKSGRHEDIIGYLYLDTDKLFNKFDVKRYKLVDSLSHLISINIDNYILKIISSTDKMTGALTRKHFDSTFSDFIKISRRLNRDFSVIMIDLDNFKDINDTFGHRMGDSILGKVGKFILDNVRKSDIVGRYGGEEFIIILPDTTIEDGQFVMEKIRKAVENNYLINEDYPITISLGLSNFPEHGQTVEELIEKADQALYVAKELGKNRSVVWSNDIGRSKKRLDKLAGIISGNTVQDQRIGLVIVEIVELIKKNMNKKEKIFRTLGRIIEILEAEQGIIAILDSNNKIEKVYGRRRFSDTWANDIDYNSNKIYEVVNAKTGEFFIDWEDIREIDTISGKPSWQSVIIVPLINNGEVKGVLQLSVPIKEKEFDYNNFNFVDTIGAVIAAML